MPHEAPPAARRGRKPKFSSDELRARTVQSSLDAVVRQGLTFGVDAIRIDRVIIEAETPRAATYEYWAKEGSGTSQENLRQATVIEFLTNVPAGNATSTGDYVSELAAKHLAAVSEPTAEDLLEIRRELIREGAAFNFALLQDQRWRVYKTLSSAIGTGSDEELRAAVAAGEERLLDAYSSLFHDLAAVFGLDLKAGLEMRHFVMSTYALNEGLSNRIGPSFANQTVVVEGLPWTVFALGFEALLEQYFVDKTPETAAVGRVCAS